MIPKIIHYTWFSGDPYPEVIQNCINSWQKYLPDYELRLWDMESIKDIDSMWLKECLAEKKWAFAADFVRLYALVNYGGIYLDTDCIIYKSFNDLISQKCFIGKEDCVSFDNDCIEVYLTSHCMGAEKGNAFITQCLAYYNDRHFILSKEQGIPKILRYDFKLLPYIQSELAKPFGYNPTPSYNKIQKLGELTVYPKNYFNPHRKISKSTYCKHLAEGKWREPWTFNEKMTWKVRLRWYIYGFFRNLLNYL